MLKLKKRKFLVEDIEEFDLKPTNELLVDKYTPLTSMELAIHKKKLDQILCISGPSGSGKTACCKVLAKEFGFDIKEYENTINTNVFKSVYGGESADYQPTGNQLNDFIKSCIQMNMLRLTNIDKNIASPKYVALIEEFPVLIDGTRSALHSVLRTYLSQSNASMPIVLIISDITDTEKYSSNEILPSFKSIIPLALQNSTKVTHIQFNTIAKTIMRKALIRVCELEYRYHPTKMLSKAELDEICASSEGDIRSALSSIQFRHIGKGKYGSIDCKRELQLSLFHGIGKVLYNKRNLNSKGVSQIDFDPEKLVESMSIGPNLFVPFLQENALNRCTDLNEAVSVTSNLSDADLYLENWEFSDILSTYNTSISIRGLMYSWNPTNTSSNTFSPLVKPRYWGCQKSMLENQVEWIENSKDAINEHTLCRISQQQDPTKLAISHNHSKRDAMLDLLPYLGKMNQSRISPLSRMNASFRQFVFKMCNYDLQKSTPIFFENDEYEQENIHLPSLRAHSTVNHALEFMDLLKRSQLKGDWDGLSLLEDIIED